MFETLMNAIVSNIFEIIIAVVSSVVAYYVIPSIKTDLIPWLKEKRLYGIVKNFVLAAEKLSESGKIEKADKKIVVIELLKRRGITIDETVESFIEGCVKELDVATSVVFEEIMKDEDLESDGV